MKNTPIESDSSSDSEEPPKDPTKEDDRFGHLNQDDDEDDDDLNREEDEGVGKYLPNEGEEKKEYFDNSYWKIPVQYKIEDLLSEFNN